MKLINSELDLQIIFLENKVNILIIEEPVLLSKTVFSLWQKWNGGESDFLLIDEERQISFSKEVELIMDPFSLELNNKKIIQQLHNEWKQEANEMTEEMVMINSTIVDVLNKIQMQSFCSGIRYNLDLEWEDLFKLYQVKFEADYDDVFDKLLAYIKIITSLMGVRLICFVNIKSYLSEKQIRQLYQMVFYCKAHLLLIENYEKDKLEDEKIFIIDKDRCLIIK